MQSRRMQKSRRMEAEEMEEGSASMNEKIRRTDPEPDYSVFETPPPCNDCRSENDNGSCGKFRECGEYRAWFAVEWHKIRKTFGKE